jgi:hypothetical protein
MEPFGSGGDDAGRAVSGNRPPESPDAETNQPQQPQQPTTHANSTFLPSFLRVPENDAGILKADTLPQKFTGECRICLSDEQDGVMCAPCRCDGSMKVVHVECLERWCRETGVISCELCTGAFPQRFVDAGETFRQQTQAARDADTHEQSVANERLQRLLHNFQQVYGRPANSPNDFAVINLNAVLEAEAFARRQRWQRSTEVGATVVSTGETNETETLDRVDADLGARVVVIDARGRAVTLNTRHVGTGGLARMMLEGEGGLGDFEAGPIGAARGGRNNAGRRIGGRRGRLTRPHDDSHGSRLSQHIARVYVGEQLRFWLKAALASLCFFLALYLVLFAVAASAPGGGVPVFIFRVVGFALPLLLISRVAYLYRKHGRDAQLTGTLDDVFVLGDVERGRGAGHANANADVHATATANMHMGATAGRLQAESAARPPVATEA